MSVSMLPLTSRPLPLFLPLSDQGGDSRLLDNLARWLMDEAKDKCGVDLDTREWAREYPREGVPMQRNGVDCGVFALMWVGCGSFPPCGQCRLDYGEGSQLCRCGEGCYSSVC